MTERERTAEWTRVRDQVPLPGIVVETKIDDEKGVRNVQRLKREGRLWWFEDGSMYCYYTPTHWRPARDEGTCLERAGIPDD